MANPHRGEVEFKAGEASYKLRLSTNQLVEAEQLGVDVTDAAALQRITAVRVLFWAGLRGGGHDVDLEGAGDLMSEIGISEAGDLVAQALTAAFPPPKEGGNPQKASPAGTGGRS